MLAAVCHGPEDLRVEQRPTPAASAGEIVLRVDYASLCATDLRILRGSHRKYGAGTVRIPGHEVVGTIAEVGNGVDGFRPGQSVFVAPNVGCGRCRQCARGQNNLCANYEALGITMDGAFAEYLRVPAAFLEQGNVMPLGEGLDPEAAALAEPFACVLHGQQGLAIGPDDVVLVMGAGPIGIMHVLAARAAGAGKILVSEQSEERLRMVAAAGADRAIDFRRESLRDVVAGETGGRGADVVLVAAGVREAMEEAPALAAIGGRINLFAGLPAGASGVTLDANLVHYRELIVTGTTGCSTADCRHSMELIGQGKVDLRPLISGRYRLDRATEAFHAARAGNVLKIVLHFGAGKGES
jgi:L-iditol 2-dehydrogenase